MTVLRVPERPDLRWKCHRGRQRSRESFEASRHGLDSGRPTFLNKTLWCENYLLIALIWRRADQSSAPPGRVRVIQMEETWLTTISWESRAGRRETSSASYITWCSLYFMYAVWWDLLRAGKWDTSGVWFLVFAPIRKIPTSFLCRSLTTCPSNLITRWSQCLNVSLG